MRSLVNNVIPSTAFKMETPYSTGVLRSVPRSLEFNEYVLLQGSETTKSSGSDYVHQQQFSLHNTSSSALRLRVSPPKTINFRLFGRQGKDLYRGDDVVFLAPGLDVTFVVEFLPDAQKQSIFKANGIKL